jgi:PAS domain S-box-containing protein
MATNWSHLLKLIGESHIQSDLFLSLIDGEGNILSTNSNMRQTLHLEDPRNAKINFFKLLHPDHICAFKTALERAKSTNAVDTAELYLKNGYYHPMKWEINYVSETVEAGEHYLCVGHKLIDDERLRRFNQLGEQNYQLIVEGLNAGILFQDSEGELIAANKKAADILGATMERLYQLKNVAELWDKVWKIHDDNGKPVLFHETPFMRAMRSRTPESEVLRVTLASGEDRWLLFNSQPLFNPGEQAPFSVVTNIVDLTTERKLSGEVQEMDSLFRSFLKMTPNLAWLLDENATLLFASQSFYKYFGLKQESSLLKNIFELIPATVADALYAKHIEVLESGKPIELLEKMKWADGSNFMFHINIFPIEGITSKKMVGGHAVNMADKFAVEKQLREANERLLMISRATSDAIWEWDMQTGYIFRNDTLMDMIGYNFDNSKGLSWWLRRIHPEDRNRVTDKIKDATDKGQHSWEDEYRFKCADGEYKHVQDKGYVVYENGLPVKMIGSLQDVSTLKQLENLLIEEKVHRQKEISETVIRVQEKERTRIGHELHDNVNQILSTTKLFVEMLKPGTEEDKTLREKSIEYLLTAIEEIRKLSKELVVPQLRENGIVESIYSVIQDIQLAGQVRIRFIHDHENDLLSNGKKITIFRIVQEQLKNILKYSQAKQVDISLQSRDDRTELIIHDDGIGFDPKQTHKGIGLSNIHDRAKFYNGTVDVQSAPGKGCTLTVNLPTLQ